MTEYQIGRDLMREEILALIAHHMETARIFHGKGSETHLRYKNLIEEIRLNHENEITEITKSNKNSECEINNK